MLNDGADKEIVHSERVYVRRVRAILNITNISLRYYLDKDTNILSAVKGLTGLES